MRISSEELIYEKGNLKKTTRVINEKIEDLGKDIVDQSQRQEEFQDYKWSNNLDKQELISIMVSSDLDFFFLEQKAKYFHKLRRIQPNPYFGSIVFKEGEEEKNIYIGITYLEDDEDNHLIYDWRSPICSMFYDYELGNASYAAPEGIVSGEITRKRQYKISKGNLDHVFDNSINIDDDLLQEVLATESSDKMKNIVNTIQQEQNKVIRNVEHKNLIVQGIAGSGKTSVALHRIAFLLYKIPNLTSKNVLIFSPNQIFTDYISNVLPELGEDNTMQTTFHDFLLNMISEYKEIESFTDFIGRYYKYKEKNPKLVEYKQTNAIIDDMENYVERIINKVEFTKDLVDGSFEVSKRELFDMFHNKYSRFPLKERLMEMATKLSETNYGGSRRAKLSYLKLLKDSINIELSNKILFYEFFKSRCCQFELSDDDIKRFVNKKKINYEDAVLFVYLKSLLEGFAYNNQIQQIVIDEAQDYTKLQYKIITNIYKKSSFTLLGDINQTINPYYKYKSLYELVDLFKGSTKYLELLKTYRSSAEIIEYANKILDLDHVSAIRKANERPVILRNNKDLKTNLINDINKLIKDYKSTALITKDDIEAMEIFNLLKDDVEISLIGNNTKEFNKDLIIVPSYMAKGLEFDSVIVYNKPDNEYLDNEKYLYYVACTRAQHELIIYN